MKFCPIKKFLNKKGVISDYLDGYSIIASVLILLYIIFKPHLQA